MTNSPEKRPTQNTGERLPTRPPPIPPAAMRDTPQGDRALPRVGEVVAGKYRIERPLGRGGMGAVFEASHVLSGKRVAVKWMLPSARDAGLADRFLHEARATARIDHPNVVDIYDVGKREDSVYLVMELLHGESLATRLERAPMSTRDVLAVLMPALRGVAAAHAQGVIHRDLKPDNIYLCTGPDGETRDCKVLDFGISKITEERDLTVTKRGTVMGTPYYMSPEQIRGLTEVDQRGDVYAFGVILYEMLGDCYPFDAETYDGLVVKIATGDPLPLQRIKPELDPNLCAVVMKAMARHRADRFQSIEELAQALETFVQGVPFHVSIVPPALSVRFTSTQPIETVRTEPKQRPFASRAARWMLVGALLLLAGSAAVWAGPGAISAGSAIFARQPADDETPLVRPAATQNLVSSGIGMQAAKVAAPSAIPATLVASRVPKPERHVRRHARVPPPRKPSAEPRAAAPPQVAATERAQSGARGGAGGLPADWDERLGVPAVAAQPAAPPVETLRGAGALNASDL